MWAVKHLSGSGAQRIARQALYPDMLIIASVAACSCIKAAGRRIMILTFILKER